MITPGLLYTLAVIGALIIAYLIGSVNFACIFSGYFIKRDIRKMGSGNAGATNVLRSAGVLPGVLTFVCDALKGALSAYLGQMIFSFAFEKTGFIGFSSAIGAFLCGLFCMLGHVFPVFFGFKGGKGVATGAGIFVVCAPLAIAVGICVFIALVLLTKYVSLGSVIATVLTVVLSFFLYDYSINPIITLSIAVAMGLIIIIKHKDNIVRLIKGTESKIGKGGKKNA